MAIQTSSQSKRSPLPFTILGLVLALLAGGMVVVLGSMAGGGGKAAGPAAATVPVVVAAQDIPIRSTLTGKEVTVAKFSPADAPPAAFSKVEDLKASSAAVDIKKGQAVTANLLVKSGDVVAGSQPAYLPIPSGFVAITIPTGEIQGVAGYIQAGDYITFIAINGTKVRTVFTNIHVLKLGPFTPPAAGSNAPPTQSGGISSSMTIVVTQCQAEFINWLISNSQLKYTLESYKDYKPQDVAADSSCPSVGAAKGVTVQDVQAKWPGLY